MIQCLFLISYVNDIFFFLLYKLAASYLNFIFHFSGKKGKPLQSSCNISGCLTSTSRKYSSSLSSLCFFTESSLNSDVAWTHLKLLTGNFCVIPHLNKLFTCQYLKCDGSFFIWIFHVFVISFCKLMNSMIYSSSNTFCYH